MWGNIMNEGTSVGASAPSAGDSTASTSQVGTKSADIQSTSSEKTQTPVEGNGGDSGNKTPEANLKSESNSIPSIPYERFAEVNTQLREAKEKAALLDKLQADPDMAAAFLRNVAPRQDQDPVRAQAEQTLREMGYVKSNDVESMVSERVSEALAQHDFQKTFIDKVRNLEAKYDGKNGAPKADIESVAKFMDENGIRDPEIAYEVMHKEALADWRASSKSGTTFTEKPGTPVRQKGDQQKADLEEARKSGNYVDYLKKYVSMPGSN